jgi:hypothetical protein
MKIYLKLFLLSCLIAFSQNYTWSANKFFIHNSDGILVKVDVASGFEKKLPKNKGPRVDQIPYEITKDKFENEIIKSLDDKGDNKNFINSVYSFDSVKKVYIIKDLSDDLSKIRRLYNDFIKYDLGINYIPEFSKFAFENSVITRISDQNEKTFFDDVYKIKKNKYILKIRWNDLEKIRAILMFANKDNEMLTGLDESGTPMPHNFSRVFETKSKANFDISFDWGVKFENNVTLGFALKLTNFTMPSLEFLVKYNFNLKNYPFEPYVGAVLYGGFIDGFPIGLNAIGGLDIFPLTYENVSYNKNLYLSSELRLGAVLFCPVYFDSGLNNEGIWKKLKILAEGGFYIGIGNIFN